MGSSGVLAAGERLAGRACALPARGIPPHGTGNAGGEAAGTLDAPRVNLNLQAQQIALNDAPLGDLEAQAAIGYRDASVLPSPQAREERLLEC